MKKNLILLLAFLLALNVNTVDAQSKRHHKSTANLVEQVVKQTDSISNAAVSTARQKANEAMEAAVKAQALADELVAKADSMEDGIEAFSDTTQAIAQTTTNNVDNWDSDNYDNPFAWLVALTASTGGILLAIFIVLMVLLFILFPFIILALLLRFIIKRHNDRVTLAEKAMENGQPIPDEIMSIDKQSEDYMWKRGIRNVAIGLGIMVMFWIWNADTLTGIGALIFCYGIGQMIISKTSKK
ncbi:MAG: hypothetical protein IIT94_03390 [Prevotella sp.]|nr:hypothetical protein [Prevotella sp.]MBQ5510174.1 hypothetical protein [Prevotella sp.]MBR6938295.1 hypothetical protein [Prevotella sp.]